MTRSAYIILIVSALLCFCGIILSALHGQTRLAPSQAPEILGGPSGVIDCVDFGPGVCDWVKAAMEQYAFTWQGAHQFEQPLTLKAQSPPSLPSPGYGKLYLNSADKRLHFMDDTGQDWAIPGTPSASAKR